MRLLSCLCHSFGFAQDRSERVREVNTHRNLIGFNEKMLSNKSISAKACPEGLEGISRFMTARPFAGVSRP